MVEEREGDYQTFIFQGILTRECGMFLAFLWGITRYPCAPLRCADVDKAVMKEERKSPSFSVAAPEEFKKTP